MATPVQNKLAVSILLRMHPLQRILLSLGFSLITWLIIRHYDCNWLLTGTVLWDAFALVFILTSWIVFFTRPVPEIIRQANKEDGSRAFVMTSIIISSFASLFTVLLLMIAKPESSGRELVSVILAIAGMILSWVMVHTIFTFHYAHMFYDEGTDDTPDGLALEFPGEKKPDYIDFAYFAFVIGMTFQVSDVEINSRKIRRTTLAHSLLAFALNTFVVALTINLIAGLKK